MSARAEYYKLANNMIYNSSKEIREKGYFCLGNCFFNGINTEWDYQKAILHYKYAGEEGKKKIEEINAFLSNHEYEKRESLCSKLKNLVEEIIPFFCTLLNDEFSEVEILKFKDSLKINFSDEILYNYQYTESILDFYKRILGSIKDIIDKIECEFIEKKSSPHIFRREENDYYMQRIHRIYMEYSKFEGIIEDCEYEISGKTENLLNLLPEIRQLSEYLLRQIRVADLEKDEKFNLYREVKDILDEKNTDLLKIRKILKKVLTILNDSPDHLKVSDYIQNLLNEILNISSSIEKEYEGKFRSCAYCMIDYLLGIVAILKCSSFKKNELKKSINDIYDEVRFFDFANDGIIVLGNHNCKTNEITLYLESIKQQARKKEFRLENVILSVFVHNLFRLFHYARLEKEKALQEDLETKENKILLKSLAAYVEYRYCDEKISTDRKEKTYNQKKSESNLALDVKNDWYLNMRFWPYAGAGNILDTTENAENSDKLLNTLYNDSFISLKKAYEDLELLEKIKKGCFNRLRKLT